MNPPACDRCYAIKSRCLPGVPGGACYRCYRLHHDCTYTRKREKPGRKRRTPVDLSDSNTSSHPSSNQEASNNVAISAPEHAPTFLPPVYSPSTISANDVLHLCKFFSVSERLSLEMRETLFTQLQSAPLLLQDPYRAVARVFLRTVTHQDPRHEAELSKCASALESLRKIQIRKAEDVSSCLALGLSLMTFQRLISGASASTICRYTLSLVQPWYQTVWDDPRISMELTCLVLFDTVQSLFRRRVPVLRYRVRDPFMVDRNVGACASLLPLLYDLCVLGASVCGEGHEHAPPNTSFGQLQRAIADWMPVFQEDTLRDFSDAETLLLMTQARLHRSAALLSLHRLQHPFGERDEEAAIISRSMMIELITCQTVAGRLPPNMVFPILVAGAEAVDLHDRHRIRFLISAINGAAFYPFISNLHGLLAGIWASRGSSDGQFLFDLFDRFPHVSVLL